MSFVPRVPLTDAERHVDFQAHYDHVTDRRASVERAGLRPAKRLAYATATTGVPPFPQQRKLAEALERALDQTATFGFRQVRRELTAQRRAARAALVFPDPGRYSQTAKGGLEQVRQHVRRRAQEAAAATVDVARDAYQQHKTLERTARVAAVTDAVRRALHNASLELVGETLNLGRASGAMSLADPPEFALRSEQLDKNTCEPCDELHGLIVQVDTPDFYANTPPAGCLGGGRCRGVWVFGDSAEQMAVDEAA